MPGLEEQNNKLCVENKPVNKRNTKAKNAKKETEKKGKGEKGKVKEIGERERVPHRDGTRVRGGRGRGE